MTVRLLPTPVPAEVTTYICMLFRVPDEVSLHLVAMQPLLNNTRVVHHMLLFGCRDGGEWVPVTSDLSVCTCQSECLLLGLFVSACRLAIPPSTPVSYTHLRAHETG